MRDLVVELLDIYKEHLFLITEYNYLNDRIKNHVKSSGGKLLLKPYSLRIVEVDKSIYSDEILGYLKSNNLEKFIIKSVDNKKLKNLVDTNVLSRELVLENIKTDKTVLDIIVPKLNEIIKAYKEELSKMDGNLLNMIEKRILLKEKVAVSKSLYYKKTKYIKDVLRMKGLSEYRFECGDLVGLIRIRIVGRVYDESFIDDCVNSDIDIFNYKVDSQKLRASKLKRVANDTNLDNYKLKQKSDYLYIRRLEKKTVS